MLFCAIGIMLTLAIIPAVIVMEIMEDRESKRIEKAYKAALKGE